MAAVATMDPARTRPPGPGLGAASPRRAGLALAALGVALIAAFLLFYRLDEPRGPIWDEAYYLTSTARYHQGRVQFASHPPLGLMLIAAGDSLRGRNAAADLSALAATRATTAERIPPDFDYLGPRLAPALFGVTAIVLFFLLVQQLCNSLSAGLLASTLVLFDPAILVQFRAAQIDAFQVCFLLAALHALVAGIRRPTAWAWAGFGLCVMLAALVRANGILIGVGGAAAIGCQWHRIGWRRSAGHALAGLVGGAAGLIAVALAHAALATQLPDPSTEAGRKDAAFLSPVQAEAVRTGTWTLAAYRALVTDQVRFIAADLAGVPRVDPNGSSPARWLLGGGAITYRWSSQGSRRSFVALVPNRPAWCLSLLGLVAGLACLGRRAEVLPLALAAIWLGSMAALIWLGGARVLYAYHYFIPLLCGYALGAYAAGRRRPPEWALFAGLASVLAWFAVLAPLIYDQPILAWRCHFAGLPHC